MAFLSRRFMVSGGLVVLAGPALAQHQHHQGQFERLSQPGRVDLPVIHHEQAVTDSPAPKAANQGRWIERAPLPIPRTEMAWGAERQGKMHLVGGYAEQRVDRQYHHVYDAATDRWITAAELPRGANHVGVAVAGNRLYAIGGFIEQNRTPHAECFVYGADGDSWSRIRPLPEACGAMACVTIGDRLHAIGGAIGNSFDNRKSIDWHLVYDPKDDSWTRRAPLFLARDHTGTLVVNGLIHVIGGRVDSFLTNSNLHHSYDPATDRWTARAPLPTARSGHGAVWYRNRIFVMGGEGWNRVYGQNEAFDPATDKWESYAPMLTPRHGTGAVVVGDAIHVAGGGPQMGGGVKSAVHEAFTLG
ncbi:MAG: Kelch repeat-containing protein [Phreatobacter sp.]